jgi:phospholipase/lecithinase/hemolysin
MFSRLLFLGLILSTVFAHAKPFNRMIVFGDSILDSGTYQAKAGPAGGGRFTINPNLNWGEILASRLELPLSENRHEGFDLPLIQLSGLNYAQGGARITKPGLGIDKGYTARSIQEQVRNYIQQHQKFQRRNLVVIAAGGNDVLANGEAVLKQKITMAEALADIDQGVKDLAQLIASVKVRGNPSVLVATLPDLAHSPRVLVSGPPGVAVFEALVNRFNQGLVQVIQGDLTQLQLAQAKMHLVRFDQIDQEISANAEAYGITNLTGTACNVNVLPGKSALFCSVSTLAEGVTAETMNSYKFSDSVHPTPIISKIFAERALEVVGQK